MPSCTPCSGSRASAAMSRRSACTRAAASSRCACCVGRRCADRHRSRLCTLCCSDTDGLNDEPWKQPTAAVAGGVHGLGLSHELAWEASMDGSQHIECHPTYDPSSLWSPAAGGWRWHRPVWAAETARGPQRHWVARSHLAQHSGLHVNRWLRLEACLVAGRLAGC